MNMPTNREMPKTLNGLMGLMAAGMTGKWGRLRRRLIGAAAIAISLCLPSHAVAQTAQGLAAADRLIAVQNTDALMKDMATNLAPTIPGTTEAQRQAFIAELTAPAFLERYKARLRVSLAKHLTVEELNALSDFYSQPIAVSALKKMGATTGETNTFIQAKIPAMAARIMKK
jgi:hypothetical protein